MVKFRDLEIDGDKKGAPLEDAGGAGNSEPQVKFSRADASATGLTQGPDATEDNRRNLYEKASLYLESVFAAARQKQAFSISAGYRIARQMVETQPFEDILFIMAIHQAERYNHVINHSVNVAIFAVKMGANLGLSKEDQVVIGMAGLLHDVGTALIPESIINKKNRLSDVEFNILKERPKHSYQIIKTCGEAHQHLAEYALQVYEKVDGSGYPHGLKGEEVHEFAQIIGLVDMYEALIHSRPQREKLLHFSAVKEIIQSCKTAFQRKHLKVLLSIFSIFPIYSFVRLNSNAIGKVIETYPDQPMRPRLKIIYDSQKRRVLTERIVNLPDNPLLYIVDSVSEEDLEKPSES